MLKINVARIARRANELSEDINYLLNEDILPGSQVASDEDMEELLACARLLEQTALVLRSRAPELAVGASRGQEPLPEHPTG